MSIDIHLNRSDRIYKPGDMVSGVVTVTTSGAMSHQGITMKMNGKVTTMLSSKTAGIFDAMYNSLKPIDLVDTTCIIQPPGKIPDGYSEFPFEFKLEPSGSHKLQETYHGVYVSIEYSIVVDLKRALLSKALKKMIQFIVEVETENPPRPTPYTFELTSENIDGAKKNLKNIPDFKISGGIDSIHTNINVPFSGYVIIEECNQPIKSLELQLRRVETCGSNEGYMKEATEIQNIQIGDGNVAHNYKIPIYMVFPRLFTCPSISSKTFKVDFEVNLVVFFSGGRHVTEKIPISIIRTKT